MRMQKDHSLIDPKDERQPELCEEAGATPQPTLPIIDSVFLHWVVIHTGITVISCLSARFKMWQASLKRKREAVPPSLYK